MTQKEQNSIDNALLASYNRRKQSGDEEVRNIDTKIAINVECKDLDIAIEKANRLVELLREAQQIIDSLSGPEKLKA